MSGLELAAKPPSSPGWGHGRPEGGLFWTKGRVLASLRRYAASTTGPLPMSNHEWSAIKVGCMDLPTAGAVLGYYKTMRRAWMAVGVDRSRLTLLNTRWSKAEVAFLLDNAGEMRLADIAQRLGRSYAAVRTKLGAKGFGIKARENQGWLSAKRIAAEYDVTIYSVQKAIATGALQAQPDRWRKSWRIDPVDAERLFGRAKAAAS